ncbi:MAG TPA: site-specific tyrosine recombinase [Gemmatimonadota bacterium]|nr:site-specific tyrosine recombinase [Gemmatimonadota bacterium]
MSETLERYTDHLLLERGLGSRTIAAYRMDIARYGRFASERGRSPDDRGTVRAYLADLGRRGLKPATIARHLTSLRSLYGFLFAEGWVAEDPTEALDAPRRRRRLPGVLSLEEVERVIEAVDASVPYPLRDRAILEFLYATGVRISELIAVQLDECDWRQRTVRLVPSRRKVKRRGSAVRTATEPVGPKGDRVRIVPVGRRALKALRSYVEDERSILKGSETEGAVFLNFRGRPLSRMGAWQIVRRYVERAGFDRKVTPHTFRHTFATHLLDRGADLRVVQEMLGHADITTTQIYTHIDPPYLRAEHRKFHPRA